MTTDRGRHDEPTGRPVDGTGGSSDDDRQPDDTGATGTLGDRPGTDPKPSGGRADEEEG
jgi:hypothetical protein